MNRKIKHGQFFLSVADRIEELESETQPAPTAASCSGHDRLWAWFSLSYASFLTLPRVMMHEMPDEWQDKMAALLEEWDDTWDGDDLPTPCVNAKVNGKFTRWVKLAFKLPPPRPVRSRGDAG